MVHYLKNFENVLNSTEELSKKQYELLLNDTRPLKVHARYEVLYISQCKETGQLLTIWIFFCQVPGYDRMNNFAIGAASTGEDVQIPLERLSYSTYDKIKKAKLRFTAHYELVNKTTPKCQYCAIEESSSPGNPLHDELMKDSKFSTENFQE